MSHLTEEQFEDVLRDVAHIPKHVDGCSLCRARYDEKYALVQRVRRASFSIQTPPLLADRIRAGVAALGESDTAPPERVRLLSSRFQRHLWSGLAAAAALLILALPVGFYLTTGTPARAAPVALEEIHHANLDSLGQRVSNNDPGALRAYLENQVGYSPLLLDTAEGLSLCGCCVHQFQGQPVASYVVRRDNFPISVIAVRQSPKALGMTLTKHETAARRGIWQARQRCCNIAAIRIGEYSYCAVGQVTQEELAVLLNAFPGPVETLR